MTKLLLTLASSALLLSGCVTRQASEPTPTEQCEVMAAHLKTDWTGKRLDRVEVSHNWGGAWSEGVTCRWSDYGVIYRRPREGSEGSFVMVAPPEIKGDTASIGEVVTFGILAGSASICHMRRTSSGWMRTGCQVDDTVQF